MDDLPLSKHLRGGKECRDNPPPTRVLKRGRGVGEAAAGGSGGLGEGDDVTCDKCHTLYTRIPVVTGTVFARV